MNYDDMGKTSLMTAVLQEDIVCVGYLLERSGLQEINAQDDDDGRTALMFAAENGSLEIVKLLLEKGADITIKDVNEWDALQYATDEWNYVDSIESRNVARGYSFSPHHCSLKQIIELLTPLPILVSFDTTTITPETIGKL